MQISGKGIVVVIQEGIDKLEELHDPFISSQILVSWITGQLSRENSEQ